MCRLGEEHQELRALARQVSEEQIAPRAAEVDETAEFPRTSYAALVATDLHAVAIPERYGGPGGDHLASVVVAEEVARACATTQQVAGGNELFAWPLLLAGSEELRSATYLRSPPGRRSAPSRGRSRRPAATSPR
jgi:alkylation response protein AidB-like acyl-CoA dehydrogenase